MVTLTVVDCLAATLLVCSAVACMFFNGNLNSAASFLYYAVAIADVVARWMK